MKFTAMCDSKGTLLKVNTSEIAFRPMDKRIEDLNIFRVEMLKALSPFEPSSRTFDLQLQPLGLEDRLIWFTKLKLEGDSELVKESQTAVKDPDYVYDSDEQEATFKSVFSVFENGKTNWYLLNVESICLTRNISDMQFIDAKLEAPIPYRAFMDKSEQSRITTEEMVLKELSDKFKFLAPNKDYHNVEQTMATALLRYEGDTIDGYIQTGMKAFVEKHIGDRDRDSNDKTFALMYLNDCRYMKGEQFGIYNELKAWVDSDPVTKAACIRAGNFRGNRMKVYRSNQPAEVYICKHPIHETPMFLSNGSILDGMDSIKNFIREQKCFEIAPLWWDEIKLLNTAIKPTARNK